MTTNFKEGLHELEIDVRVEKFFETRGKGSHYRTKSVVKHPVFGSYLFETSGYDFLNTNEENALRLAKSQILDKLRLNTMFEIRFGQGRYDRLTPLFEGGEPLKDFLRYGNDHILTATERRAYDASVGLPA